MSVGKQYRGLCGGWVGNVGDREQAAYVERERDARERKIISAIIGNIISPVIIDKMMSMLVTLMINYRSDVGIDRREGRYSTFSNVFCLPVSGSRITRTV